LFKVALNTIDYRPFTNGIFFKSNTLSIGIKLVFYHSLINQTTGNICGAVFHRQVMDGDRKTFEVMSST